jgi:hypothetical protein
MTAARTAASPRRARLTPTSAEARRPETPQGVTPPCKVHINLVPPSYGADAPRPVAPAAARWRHNAVTNRMTNNL